MTTVSTDGTKSFDLQVHKRDSKTGKIIRTNDYICKISKEHGTVYVRNGIEYHTNGEPVHAPQVKEVQLAPKAELREPEQSEVAPEEVKVEKKAKK